MTEKTQSVCVLMCVRVLVCVCVCANLSMQCRPVVSCSVLAEVEQNEADCLGRGLTPHTFHFAA